MQAQGSWTLRYVKASGMGVEATQERLPSLKRDITTRTSGTQAPKRPIVPGTLRIILVWLGNQGMAASRKLPGSETVASIRKYLITIWMGKVRSICGDRDPLPTIAQFLFLRS